MVKLLYRITFLFIIVNMLIMVSCSNKTVGEDYYCVDCISEEPDTAQLIVKVSYQQDKDSIKLLVYNNKFSLDTKLDTILNDTIAKDVLKFYVKVNEYYSAEAIYYVGGKEIHAIDGGWFETKKIEGCQNTCWKLIGGDYDLRLK